MRIRTSLAALLVVAFVVTATAAAATKPTPAQSKAIVAAAQKWWCSYIPKNEGPCSRWTVRAPSILISSADPTWGYAQLRTHTSGKTELPAGLNALVRNVKGKWTVYGWFIALQGMTCAAGAKDVGVPYAVVRDLGLCSTLVRTP